jgi:hypothetical protein
MKSFLAKLLASIQSFLGSSQAHDIEKAVAVSALPIIEQTVIEVSHTNSVASEAVQVILIPAINTAVSNLEKPKN